MNLIKPEVYSPIVREKFDGRVKIAALATDLGYLKNTTAGEVVSFPKFKTISEAEEMTRGSSLVPEELDQTESTAKIKQIGKAVRVYDMDDLTAFGNFVDEASTQQAVVFARAVDKDLAVECQTSPLKVQSPYDKYITSKELSDAMVLFGDEQDFDSFAGIIINSLTLANVYEWDDFVKTDRTFNTDNNGIVKKGLVGYWRGIPMYIADHGTYDSVNQEIITYIIKKNALGIMTKRDVNIELEREAKLKATDVVGDLIYAVKLLMDDGVVYIKKTV